MNTRNRFANRVGFDDWRRNTDASEQRQGMALHPSTSDGGEWDGKEQNVQRHPHHLGGYVHPSWQLRWLGSRVDHSPNDTQRDEHQDTDSQGFVQLPIKVA